jgi:hypothetical protein
MDPIRIAADGMDLPAAAISLPPLALIWIISMLAGLVRVEQAARMHA